MSKEHRFPYKWTLKDAVFTKDKGKVFSCFSCGGGSSFGYKLAGFDVIGCNEIDPKMMAAYVANHNPKYSYLEPIQTFKLRNDLPDELYNLDILDGSPPCSSFSMVGNREKDWGKEKKFREGQSLQELDTLFFDFIELAAKLKPKVVIAENVKGLLMGEAKAYVRRIYKEFDEAGYYCGHWLLDASKMGVPQRRERVFFICLRKDLAEPFLYQQDMFTVNPYLKLEFNEKEIPYKEIECGNNAEPMYTVLPGCIPYWSMTKNGESFQTVHPKNHFFQCYKADPNRCLPTFTPHDKNRQGVFHYDQMRTLTKKEIHLLSTFPLDYNPEPSNISYLAGMGVPPVMVAQIATEVYIQWLSKINLK